MALRAQAGTSDLTSKAFERSANAFEALVRNGDPESPDRGFRRTIAAAAYHLAGFSAVAYSLFNETAGDLNTSPGETAIQHLILRDLGQLRGFVREWLDNDDHKDEQIAEVLRVKSPMSMRLCRPSSTRRSAGRWRILISRLRRAKPSRSRQPGQYSTPRSALQTMRRMSPCGGSRTSVVTLSMTCGSIPCTKICRPSHRKERRKNTRTCAGYSSHRSMLAKLPRWSCGHRSAKQPGAPPTSRTIWLSPYQPAQVKREWPRLPL